jgi:hypothetical protein
MALLTMERVAALRGSGLFAEVPDHVLAGLARVAEEEPVDAGTVVITRDDEDDSMLVSRRRAPGPTRTGGERAQGARRR